MEAILDLVLVGFIIAIGVTLAVLIPKSDGKGCADKGGPGCYCCPFPCEYNHTGER